MKVILLGELQEAAPRMVGPASRCLVQGQEQEETTAGYWTSLLTDTLFNIAIDAIILVQVQLSTRTTGLGTLKTLPVGSHKSVVFSTRCMFQGSTGFASMPINLDCSATAHQASCLQHI